jgi:hypothetical protein
VKHLHGEEKAVPLPRGPSYLLAWPFAADRIDTWVLKVSIAIPLVCLAGMGLWHLVAYLAAKRPRKPRMVRLSPEPPRASPAPRPWPRGQGLAEAKPTADDPERLQQACTALEGSLVDLYLQLAESCLRQGQPQQATAAWNKIILISPGGHQAQLARDRLQQLGKEAEEHPP